MVLCDKIKERVCTHKVLLVKNICSDQDMGSTTIKMIHRPVTIKMIHRPVNTIAGMNCRLYIRSSRHEKNRTAANA